MNSVSQSQITDPIGRGHCPFRTTQSINFDSPYYSLTSLLRYVTCYSLLCSANLLLGNVWLLLAILLVLRLIRIILVRLNRIMLISIHYVTLLILSNCRIIKTINSKLFFFSVSTIFFFSSI